MWWRSGAGKTLVAESSSWFSSPINWCGIVQSAQYEDSGRSLLFLTFRSTVVKQLIEPRMVLCWPTLTRSSKQQPSEGEFVVRGAVDLLSRTELRPKKAAAAAKIDAKKPLLCSPPAVILIL